jgi:hypothetical protein
VKQINQCFSFGSSTGLKTVLEADHYLLALALFGLTASWFIRIWLGRATRAKLSSFRKAKDRVVVEEATCAKYYFEYVRQIFS